MQKQTKTLLLTAALAVGLSTPAMAANVQATLPNFPVTLNGTVIDNTQRQYPLLVYKNITYFPMTYYDCRFLGVETEWTKQNGLKIEKSSLTGAYHQDKVSKKNPKQVTARISDGKITVNGKSINNSQEQYPLLSYNNVTYFPLTWRFAVNEFGWKYSYDNKNGLVIDAGNVKTKSVTLQDAHTAEYETDQFGFAIDGTHLYYQGEQGAVYQRPLNNLTNDKQRKTVTKMPDGLRSPMGLSSASGRVYLYYYTGGATMGSGHKYRLKADGTVESIFDGKYGYYDFGTVQILAPEFVPPDPAKLFYQDKNGTRELGEANYLYREGSISQDGGFMTGGSQVAYWNQQLYSLGYTKGAQSRVCRVDIQTGKTTPLSEYPATDFVAADGYVYYLSGYRSDGTLDNSYTKRYLRALNLVNGQECYVGDVGESDINSSLLYTAAGQGVFYRNNASGSLVFYNAVTGKRQILNDGFQVNCLTVQDDSVVAMFEEHSKSNCRLAVYKTNGSGVHTVFATADVSDKAVVNENGLLMYRLAGTKQLVQVQL